jgi:hypothetical protein
MTSVTGCLLVGAGREFRRRAVTFGGCVVAFRGVLSVLRGPLTITRTLSSVAGCLLVLAARAFRGRAVAFLGRPVAFGGRTVAPVRCAAALVDGTVASVDGQAFLRRVCQSAATADGTGW